MKKIKLTALERSWILYDIGNSAFILLVSTLIPIYFYSLASDGGLNESLYLSYWGYAGSAATLLVAVIGRVVSGAGAMRYLSVSLQLEVKRRELLQSILKAMAEILAQKS